MTFHELLSYLSISAKYLLNIKAVKGLRKFHIMTPDETIDYIITNKCSISRFGDGEFQLAWQYLTGKDFLCKTTFQKYDKRLGWRLSEIMSTPPPRTQSADDESVMCLICIPHVLYKGGGDFYQRARIFTRSFVNAHHDLLANTLDSHYLYGDTNVTRFYLSHKNKNASRKHIEKFRQVWQNRKICFIEGEKTRLGVGNDLFSGAVQITRIICPSYSAFDYYDQILAEACKLDKDTLLILALGMTATVLAVDLSAIGYQAIDVGHIDIEYEWMKMCATKKVAIPTKYTNEVADGQTPINIENAEYNSQILIRIGC